MSQRPVQPDCDSGFCVIIPARMRSTRLPGKPLADIHGRPMLAWVHDCAALSGAQFIVIATDDDAVLQASEAFGARVVLTSPEHQSGTDRLAEVINELDLPDHQIVVNLQGDEPLMVPALLRQVAQLLSDHPEAALATLMVPIVDPHEFHDPAAVKVVVNQQGQALYFSRSPIPCYRDGLPELGQVLGYRHLGLYAYRAGFLRRFVATPMAALEQAEKLEQLRALAMGESIAIALAQATPPVGVDTPADLARVRAVLAPRTA
ncbi:MAG: 3-deoxy-manno-octulosonate cytidylyltransferase [Halothiobacillus sp. 20-53-49]|nr:3-deoxy-manno-octulosonate cytidylyltransferase [Halothiobacillaceae bacterium]OYV46167.1 MAG: 3-deoxy-manno-octulosonate cytidylyltransferase [Halothiobacillus sp. 20-53-49]HUM98938.1 3-deoxy-manno-octulosonate cytidylyltransferase [Halothiobacillus sp.]